MSAANSSPDAPAPDSAITVRDKPVQKAFSCILCAHRKVKCDKAPGGCSNCIKARLTCIYKAPLPPRRRKRAQGRRELDVQARCDLYERALRARGVDVGELVKKELEGAGTGENIRVSEYGKGDAAARGTQGGEPPFIQVLRARKAKEAGKPGKAQRTDTVPVQEPRVDKPEARPSSSQPWDLVVTSRRPEPMEEPVDTCQWDAGMASTFDDPPMGDLHVPMLEDSSNWSNWDNPMLNFELRRANGFAMDGSGFQLPFGGSGGGGSFP